MLAALGRGEKGAHRFVVDAGNSTVRPGGFAGLNLETGRLRILDGNEGNPSYEIRAQCRFPSGDVRAVSVQPKFKKGDLFWVSGHGGKLPESRWTLEVVGVGAARLQDMSDEDARNEGLGNGPEPRAQFERLWGRRAKGANHWRKNPWVWVVRFKAHAGNIHGLFGAEV